MQKKLIRLNLFLSRAGIGSRRGIDDMILAGRIAIKGATVRELGVKVDENERDITVDGIPLDLPKRKIKHYFAFFKPQKVVTTLSDPEGRPCIADYLGDSPRGLYPVGRLDYDADGLLILTNDGDLANTLMHPRHRKEKVYLVKVKGRPTFETISQLRRGIRLEDGFAKPLRLSLEKKSKQNTWFRMTLTEGRYRQVKRMWLRVGHPVVRLTRVLFAGIGLADLKPGQIRRLTQVEIAKLTAHA